MWDLTSLEAWERACELAVDVYRASASFPEQTWEDAKGRLRWASVCISANLAEGCGRYRGPEITPYVRAALASTEELDFQLLLARDEELINGTEYKELTDAVLNVRRLLIAFLGQLKLES